MGKREMAQRVSTSSPVSISSTTSDLSESLCHAQGHSSSKDLSHDYVQKGCQDLQDPPSASSNPHKRY